MKFMKQVMLIGIVGIGTSSFLMYGAHPCAQYHTKDACGSSKKWFCAWITPENEPGKCVPLPGRKPIPSYPTQFHRTGCNTKADCGSDENCIMMPLVQGAHPEYAGYCQKKVE